MRAFLNPALPNSFGTNCIEISSPYNPSYPKYAIKTKYLLVLLSCDKTLVETPLCITSPATAMNSSHANCSFLLKEHFARTSSKTDCGSNHCLFFCFGGSKLLLDASFDLFVVVDILDDINFSVVAILLFFSKPFCSTSEMLFAPVVNCA